MSEKQPVRLVLIGGSLRSQSVNGAVIATAAELVPAGARAVIFKRLGELPHFNPDDDHDPLPEPVADLRKQLEDADAVLFSTPEYAGSLPGAFKNLLDWSVGGSGLYRLPAGWINPSALGGARDTYHALRIVLSRAGADIVESACRDIPVSRDAVGADGLIESPEIRAAIRQALDALLEAARKRSEADGALRPLGK
jgi:NAD(P)H-dependent FMN reductase